jgi:hypothetical protein
MPSLSDLVQKVKELPDIREDKVQVLAEQIARGEFSLEPVDCFKHAFPGREEGI